MKILLTADPEIPVPPEFYGGIQRIVSDLAIHLNELGHDVALVARSGSTCPIQTFFPWSVGSSRGHSATLRNSLTLLRAVQSFRPNVIHSFSRLGYLTPLLPCRVPKIMSYQRAPGTAQVRAGVRLGRSLLYTGCSRYISYLGSHAGGRWHSIPNFVDLDRYPFRARVADGAPLVFLSRIEPVKGAHIAIQIAKRSGRRLLIAGNRAEEGPSAKYWEMEIEPHLGKNIEYIGPVNDQQKAELLGDALALVVPIQWDEPFGIVFIEALACGTPLLTFEKGAASEIIRHGREGFFMRHPSDGVALVERLSDIDRAKCRARAEESFSAQVVVSQYERLYQLAIRASMDGRAKTEMKLSVR